MTKQYDLVVLGGGTGGYVAAIRASQLGLKTAIVEKEKLGGTCLHSGCIPSKALLRSAEIFSLTSKSEQFGIKAKDVMLNFEKVQQRKNKIVSQLHHGIHHLMKQNKVDIYKGFGRILGPSIFSPLPGTITVEMNDQTDNVTIASKNLLISTGSKPKSLKGLPFDGKYIISSAHALQFQQLPQSILIIGGGAIGVEWASMLADFGVEVIILEFESKLVPQEDEEISRELERLLKSKKVKIVTDAEVLPETVQIANGITITANIKGVKQQFSASKMIVSIGRDANIANFGLENSAIEIKNGSIVTNEFYQTKEEHIYAIGDVIGGPQLAHVAAYEGIIAVEHLANKCPEQLQYEKIPRCIYTNPEIASFGLTEKEAIAKQYDVKIGKFPFRANGKALVFGQSDGFVKIIANRASDDILGVHIIGPKATELICEAGLAQILNASPWELTKFVHPHPTLTEVIGEAALAVDNKAIHS